MNTLLMPPFSVRVRPSRNNYELNNWMPRVLVNNDLKRTGINAPLVNIIKTENTYELHLAAPGYSKDQIKLSIDDNILKVEAKITEEPKENENYTLKEFNVKGFERSFILPENADVDNITANANNGILTISISTKVEEKKTININVQ